MRAKKLVVFPLILFVLFACFALFFASPREKAEASAEPHIEDGRIVLDSDYWFESVDVRIEVGRDKKFQITETMKVGFIYDMRNTGIIRDIQRVSQTTRIRDGKKEKGAEYLTAISDVSVTVNGGAAKVTQELYDNGQFYSVKMQKPDESRFPKTDQSDLENTLNTFVLSYTYDMSDDKVSGYDDFTFDVLGYAMAFTRKFHAVIEFPEGLPSDADISARTNKMAAWEPTEENGEHFTVSGNRIEMAAKGYSQKENDIKTYGYTVQVLLPDGYFSVSRTVFPYYFAFAGAALAAIAAGIVIFIKYAPRKLVEPVEFYPPAGMRAMRYSSVWNGGARKKDVAAVVVQWASEGFVTLERDGKKDLIVTKLKDLTVDGSKALQEDYDGGLSPETVEFLKKNGCNALLNSVNEYLEDRKTGGRERAYFNAMFPAGDYTGSESFSTKSMRFGAYPARARKLASEAERLKADADTPDPLKPHSKRAHVLLTVFMLVPMLMALVYFCILNMSPLPAFFFVFMAAGTFVGSMQARQRLTWLMYIFPLAFMALPLFAFSSFLYMPLYDYAGLLWISLVWWAAGMVMLHFVRRRSPEAEKQLEKMRGFRNFLLTAELSRIEMLLDENPDYYYNIIPYCLIMGISDKVAKRFEPLNIAAPEWARDIPVAAFSSFSHSLSSSSGGGSSGGGGGGHGGSSGGGGGGGGSRSC